jgi:hypothetical protein
MKIICIKNIGYERHLTIGKTYEVIKIVNNGYYYVIIYDENDKWIYPKKYFKPLSEYRIEKINKLLEE